MNYITWKHISQLASQRMALDNNTLRLKGFHKLKVEGILLS